MGLLNGILWVFGIILILNSELTLAQNKRSSSRVTSSRSFGTNIKASSSSSSSVGGVNFDCPEEFGYYPHPNDCTQYYVCVFGGALLESCTGGLMYSHELQTCDWPRNVGCDVTDGGASISVSSGGSSSYRDVTPRVPQIKQQQQQQQPQHVPHRVRFGSVFSSSTPLPLSKPTHVQQYQPRQQQQQVIQAQVQTLPPPPELRVAPNPVITSRGQPKPLLDSHEDIAKLYADAHDTLPPVEEEENDRQQRVYRGQPSTVGQVQRDRDGIIHQASINAIPNHGKIGSYAYGAQINQYRRDDVDNNSIDLRRQRREVKPDTDEPERHSLTFTNATTDATNNEEDESTETDTDDNTTEADDSETDESVRSTRQLRPLAFNPRLNRWQLTSSNYRAVDSNPYQQQSFSFGAFNPFLAPPQNPHLKDLKGNPLNVHSKPKHHFAGLSYSITPTTQSPLEAYKPFSNYYPTSTSRPPPFQHSDLLPFLLQSLKDIQQQKKKKLAQADNFSYFHLENDAVTPPTKATPSSHYSQFSAVGGFYNNFDNQQALNLKPTPAYQPSKLISQFSIASPPVEVTTQSNYFQYNILQNQKMKSFYTTTTTTTPAPPTSNFQIVSAPNLFSGLPAGKTHQFWPANQTTTPLPSTRAQKPLTYVKPGTISSNFNFGELMSGIKYSNMGHMQPALVDMFKYFKQTAGPAGHRGKVTKPPISTTTNEEYEYYDEEEDLKTKKPTVNTKPPKGYESFIKSIPNQSYKSQTKFTLKNTKPTTPRPLKSSDDYYYDEEDDYQIRHPPSEKPPYMPNSETMAPRPPQNSTPRYKRPNSVTGYFDVTTRRPVFSSHFQHDGSIPSFINFPSDIFQDLRHHNSPPSSSTDSPYHRPNTPSTATTTTVYTTTTPRPYTSTTTRKVYTVRPNRGHSKWKYNKASEATKTDHRKRPTPGQRPQHEQDDSNRVESSSQAPPPPPPPQPSANIFISQQRPQIVDTNPNGNRNYYNTSSYETQQQQQSYDPYYSVYDDDIDLYRDVEYSNQQQQQQQVHQQQSQHQLRGKVPQQQQQQHHQQAEPLRPTYRPEIITTPSQQQVPVRETYVSKPIQKPLQQESKPFNNQQSLIYNSDYDEDLIAQIEQDNEYDQPTRAPIRGDRFTINSISDRPIVVSSTVDIDDEPFYASLSSTLAPQTDSIEEQDPFDIPFVSRKPSPSPPSVSLSTTFEPKAIATVPADEYSIFGNTQPTTVLSTTSTSSSSTTTPSTTTSTTPSTTTSTTSTTTTQTPPQYDTTQSTTTTKRSNRLSDDGISSTTNKATPKSVILTFTSNAGLTNQSNRQKTNTDSILNQSPSETTPSVQVASQNQLKRESSEEKSEEAPETRSTFRQFRGNSTKSRTLTAGFTTSSPRSVQILNRQKYDNGQEEEDEEKTVTEYQRKRILSYIMSDVEPQSFKPPVARLSKTTSTTERTAIHIPQDNLKGQRTYRFNLSQGYRGFSLKGEEPDSYLAPVSETESEEKVNNAEVPMYFRSRTRFDRKESDLNEKEEDSDPTTYTPIRSWRFSRTSPLPFAKHDSNVLNAEDIDDSPELEPVVAIGKGRLREDYVSSSGSERSLVTERSTTEPLQSFTARASLFKDNLSRTYDTTGPTTKFVSPYKSLETILQEKEDSLKFNSIRSTPAPRSSSSTVAYQPTTQKPFRSYFLITSSPPRILNNTSTPTTARAISTSSWRLNQTTSVVWPSSTLPTTTSTTTTTTTTTTTPKPTTTTSTTTITSTTPEPETLPPPTTVVPTTTIRLPSTSFRSKIRQEVVNFNPEARSRGRSRYTASFSNALDDEPTTYSPKYRFTTAQYDSTTYSPETPSYRRRARPTVTRQPKSTTEREFFHKARKPISDFENESYDRPRSEALIGLSINKNDNTYTDKPPRYTTSTASTTTENVVEITDRSVQYYSKYRTTATPTPERTLAESLKNAGYLSNSRGKYRDLGFDEEIRANVEEIVETTASTTTSASTLPTTSTIPPTTITSLPPRTTTTTPKPTTTPITTIPSTTTTTSSTTTTTPSTTIPTTTIPSTTSTASTTKAIIPPRASRVNTAIKTSIAAASNRNKALASSAFAKCADSTPNAKCNEIPSRTNSNNRNRGSTHSNGAERDQPATVTSNRGTHPPRTRPTLKPSVSIVSKAQEFVDIYRYPPTRPEPLYPQPTPDKTAAKCRKDVCLLPDCYCGGKDIPADLPVESIPQIVLLTFDDSVNDLNKQLYTDLFDKGRVNPNGCPISATFYVSHEWTDYSQVQNLYSDGHEIASHTVSHSFGEQFSQKKWTREVAGQREILAAYGGVKLSDVRGMRAPFLSVGGNKMYKMLYDSNFTYDSSMPVYENRPPSWPYTLDYKIFHDCMIPPCPTKSYPGVWQVPMVMWQDLNGGRCSMGDACSNPGDAEGVYKMIMKNFERHYTTNRAPFGLFYHAAWFTQPHHKEGFIKFLDAINSMQDVWILTNWQALQWVRDPTPISRVNSFQPFQCDYSDRPKRCNNPKVCNLWHKSGVRYMRTCQPCPDIYPWTGKTGIRSSRVDNDIEES